MSSKNLWKFKPAFIAMACVLFALALLSLLWNFQIFICEMSAALIILILAYIRYRRLQADIHSLLKKASQTLNPNDRESLAIFPLPAVIVQRNNVMLWYNDKFRESIISKKDCIGTSLKAIAPTLDLSAFDSSNGKASLTAFDKKYTVFGSKNHGDLYFLYWVEDTALKNAAQEYQDSRPCICIIMIDNYEDLLQNAKEGEKSVVIGAVEKKNHRLGFSDNRLFTSFGQRQILPDR